MELRARTEYNISEVLTIEKTPSKDRTKSQNLNRSTVSSQGSQGSEIKIPLYSKTLEIPHIKPNCLEMVDTATIAFACSNGFYIAKFEDEDTVELIEVLSQGNYWDTVYFPELQLYYTYNYANNKIYTISPFYEYSVKDLPVFADGDSRCKQLRADKVKNFLFIVKNQNTITVFDAKKDFNNWEILKAINKAKKAAQKIKGLKNKKFARKFFKNSNEEKRKSIKLEFNRRQSRFEKKDLNSNFNAIKVEENEDFEENSNFEQQLNETKYKAQRNLDFLTKNIADMLNIKSVKKKQKKPQLKYSQEDLRESMDSIDMAHLSDETAIRYDIKDVPGDFIRDFQVDSKSKMMVVLSNDCHLSLWIYCDQRCYMFNKKKLEVRGIGYSVSVSPGGRYICVSTTTLNLNLIDMCVLELDSKQQLHEICRLDFTSSHRFAQPYSCFGFANLDFTVGGEQLLICGQECADNNMLVYQISHKSLTKVKAKAMFSSFVNKAVFHNGWLWVAEHNGNLSMIRFGEIEDSQSETESTQGGYNFLALNSSQGYNQQTQQKEIIENFDLSKIGAKKPANMCQTMGKTQMLIHSEERGLNTLRKTTTVCQAKYRDSLSKKNDAIDKFIDEMIGDIY